jgi:hypothetical protein
VALNDVLPVVAVVGGLTGAVLGLSAFIRDRSRLIFHTSQGMALGGEKAITLWVANAGRQPIGLIEIGVFGGETVRRRHVHRRYRSGYRRRLPIASSAPALGPNDEPLVLKPGDMSRFTISWKAAEIAAGPSYPVFVYALDFRGRWILDSTPIVQFETPSSQQPA